MMRNIDKTTLTSEKSIYTLNNQNNPLKKGSLKTKKSISRRNYLFFNINSHKLFNSNATIHWYRYIYNDIYKVSLCPALEIKTFKEFILKKRSVI